MCVLVHIWSHSTTGFPLSTKPGWVSSSSTWRRFQLWWKHAAVIILCWFFCFHICCCVSRFNVYSRLKRLRPNWQFWLAGILTVLLSELDNNCLFMFVVLNVLTALITHMIGTKEVNDLSIKILYTLRTVLVTNKGVPPFDTITQRYKKTLPFFPSIFFCYFHPEFDSWTLPMFCPWMK